MAFRWRIAALVITLAATVAIASTARVFSGTIDEPAHLAAGMQWLSTGDYTYDPQHPPLGRVAAAFGPYLAGDRTTGQRALWDEGAAILGSGAHYVHALALARYGELPFFLVLCLAVWLWGRRLLGEAGGALAVFFVATNPNILAHAGLATTDISVTAFGTLALFLGVKWIERPSTGHALAFGAVTGLAVASKFSAIPFIGAPLVAVLLLQWFVAARSSRLEAQRLVSQLASQPASPPSMASPSVEPRVSSHEPRHYAPTALLTSAWGAVACLVIIWAAYRFAVGPTPFTRFSVPAPALVRGLDIFLTHGNHGHPTFLLGQPGNTGWWYYFPVALLVKTPLPLLALSLVGAGAAITAVRRRGAWQQAVPLLAAAVILAVSLTVRVNIGVRHVLPVYPLLAIAAAAGVLDLWQRREQIRLNRGAAAVLVGCALWIVVRAHPDDLAYFNPLAGPEPEHVLVDSNLDWGQDLYRLRDTLAARGVTDTVKIAYFGMTDFSAVGLTRARELGLHERPTGWIAASKTFLAGEWVGGAYVWLLDYPPLARIGRSMLLWYLPKGGE